MCSSRASPPMIGSDVYFTTTFLPFTMYRPLVGCATRRPFMSYHTSLPVAAFTTLIPVPLLASSNACTAATRLAMAVLMALSAQRNRPFHAHAKTYNSLLEKTFGRPQLNRQHRPPEFLLRLYLLSTQLCLSRRGIAAQSLSHRSNQR